MLNILIHVLVKLKGSIHLTAALWFLKRPISGTPQFDRHGKSCKDEDRQQTALTNSTSALSCVTGGCARLFLNESSHSFQSHHNLKISGPLQR